MHIDQLVNRFRKALDDIRASGGFENSYFCDFPRGCCGTASDLLALYLSEYGIKTLCVFAIRGEDSHAWLVVADDELYEQYSVGQNIDNVDYDMFDELKSRQIIDITADQYKNRADMECYNKPVYIGMPDEFHKKFTVDCIGDYVNMFASQGMCPETYDVWDKVKRYLGEI